MSGLGLIIFCCFVRNQVGPILLQPVGLDAWSAKNHRVNTVPERLIVNLLHAFDDLVASLLEVPLQAVELTLSEP